MKQEVKVNALYRHFKGGFYRVLAIAKTEKDGQEVVVYQSITSGTAFTRPLEEFFTDVASRPDNVTGQTFRMELASSVFELLKFAHTGELVAELNSREDNPYSGHTSNDEKENIWSSEYLLGKLIKHEATETEQEYTEFYPLPVRTFDTLDRAKGYCSAFALPKDTVIARRVIRKVET